MSGRAGVLSVSGRSASSSPGAGGDQSSQDDDKERELAAYAQWKLIQKNCFTRWTNERLKVSDGHKLFISS